MAAQGGNYCLFLSQLPIHFDPMDKVGGVFFDSYNNHVLCVQKNNTDVNVKGLDARDNFLLNIPAKGVVKTIKFSGGAHGTQRVLSIQRHSNSVEFVSVFSSSVKEISLPRKPGKLESSEILDFFWVFQSELVVIVRKGGIDVYQFDISGMDFKVAKSIQANIGWVLFSQQSEHLLIRIKDSNLLYLYGFRRGSGAPIYKVTKFEVDMPSSPNAARNFLNHRDVVIMSLYSNVYIAVRTSTESRGTCATLYQPAPDGSCRPAHRLVIDANPPIMMTVVDNLCVVHHQISKTSMIFDIHLDEGAHQGGVSLHHPITSPLPIAPTRVQPKRSGGRSPIAPSQSSGGEVVDLYSVNWLIFQPNTIIDVKMGIMWQLKLNLEAVKTMIIDKTKLTYFLYNRSEGKEFVLSLCVEGLESSTLMPFQTLSLLFNIICQEHKLYLLSSQEGGDSPEVARQRKPFTISPSDMYARVFNPYKRKDSFSPKMLLTMLSEYIRALHKHEIKIDTCISELLMSVLIETKNFYQLQQFIQYHVIEDSSQLACLLVSKELVYPAGTQLALDMYRRQPNSEGDIIDIMFSRGQILTALRLVRSLGWENTVSARQFLEAAVNEGNKMVFYSIYKFFEERNLRLRSTKEFPPGEQCKPYEDLFNEWFPEY